MMSVRTILTGGVGVTNVPTPEDWKLVRNISEVVFAIFILLLSLALSSGVSWVEFYEGYHPIFPTLSVFQAVSIAMAAAHAFAALVFWGLAELVLRGSRTFLPSVAICICFTIFVMYAALCAYYATTDGDVGRSVLWSAFQSLTLYDAVYPSVARPIVPVIASAGLLAISLFGLRFRPPFSTALVASFLVLLLEASLYLLSPKLLREVSTLILFGSASALFIAAMWFDLRSSSRSTRISDAAFWLQVVAASFLAFGVLAVFQGQYGIDMEVDEDTLEDYAALHRSAGEIAAAAISTTLGCASLVVAMRRKLGVTVVGILCGPACVQVALWAGETFFFPRPI